MKNLIDIAALLSPIPGDNPAGEELRYAKVYDDIKEARRADDVLPQGEWQREIKTSEWRKVISLSVQALTDKSKDIQIAVWLTEALTMMESFEGFEAGVSLITGLLDLYWENAYPQIEDDDYDYRIAPLEFFNDKIAHCVKQLPLTDPRTTPGYSLLKWQETRDTTRKGEDKITSDDFNAAVAKSSVDFYKSLAEIIPRCLAVFTALDEILDARLATQAPSISNVGKNLEECQRLVAKICTEQKGIKGIPADAAMVESGATGVQDEPGVSDVPLSAEPSVAAKSTVAAVSLVIPAVGDETAHEEALWNDALRIMQNGNFKEGLNRLLAVATSQPSERGRCRYQFLVAKLCLKGGRPELARPILEKLLTLINELQLERWESPFWVAEILESMHQCLLSGEPSGEDTYRASELFKKICTMDVTKVLNVKQ